jgi:hypothetical protein
VWWRGLTVASSRGILWQTFKAIEARSNRKMGVSAVTVKSQARVADAELPRLNHEEAAKFLGCTPLTLYQWCSRGLISYEKEGSANRYTEKELGRFKASRRRVIRASVPPQDAAE